MGGKGDQDPLLIVNNNSQFGFKKPLGRYQARWEKGQSYKLSGD